MAQPQADPPLPSENVGFITSADMLMIASVLQAELTVARDIADDSPAWLAQAQALERVLPVLQHSDIIVIE